MDTEKLISIVCEVCECNEKEINGLSRKSIHVIARKIIIQKTRYMPLNMSGKLINRSHSVVKYHRSLFELDLLHYELFRICYNKVERICNQ